MMGVDERSREMFGHLLYIEDAISIHNLARHSDEEYLEIVITAKAAKEIIKTINEVIQDRDSL